MKRFGNIYEKICTLENLQLADKKARRGKSKNRDIINFDKNKDENILVLYSELQSRTFITSKYSYFTIFEPKRRDISKLPYRDRIVHHAILNILEPIFTRMFISQTYSCIKERGIHKCLKDMNKSLRNISETEFCLKIDVKKFYPSVDNKILKNLLRRKFKDPDLLNLLDDIINSIQGLPLGNFTSQWFGNFYLTGFDHWIKEMKKIKHYYRYCDDIVIFHSSKKFLHQLRREIDEYLFIHLNLILSNKQVFPVWSRGIDFLGYKSYHYNLILLRKSIKKRFKKMLLKNPNQKSIDSYLGWCKLCNSINLVRKLLKIQS